MVFTLNSGITHSRKSRVSHTCIYKWIDAEYNDYSSRYRKDDRNRSLWRSIFKVEWRKYPSHFHKFWRNSRYRFSLYSPHRWRSLHTGDHNQSSRSRRNNRYIRNYRTNLHYYIALCLLAISLPVRAEDPKVSNTSSPVAAATGNVTNQALQFQNNGAPSRQHYGPNISCNGSTLTWSPFYMGNHVKPYDPDGYTMNENWGMQLNFMIPLDKRGLEQCRRIAARQEEKMRLDYELVRALKCSELQQRGFMLRPQTRVAHMCHDVIPIAQYIKEEKLKNPPPEPEKKNWLSNPFKKNK